MGNEKFGVVYVKSVHGFGGIYTTRPNTNGLYVEQASLTCGPGGMFYGKEDQVYVESTFPRMFLPAVVVIAQLHNALN